MGFYLRKSIRVGPLRFNLSGSGIGVSAGIRGFRVGTGPRGNYVHMGVGGLYYRSTLPSGSTPSSQPTLPPTYEHPGTAAPMKEIHSGPVSQMADSSSAALLSELNHKKRRLRRWPLAAVVSIGLLCALAGLTIMPALRFFSNRSVRRPRSAVRIAASNPAAPAPTTTTSQKTSGISPQPHDAAIASAVLSRTDA